MELAQGEEQFVDVEELEHGENKTKYRQTRFSSCEKI